MFKIIKLTLLLFISACAEDQTITISEKLSYDKKEHPSFIVATSQDDLNSIANSFDVRITDLMRINSLKPNSKIRTGQKIYLPNNKYYTSKPNQSLAQIAKLFDVDVGVIAKANNIKFPYKVRLGQTLKIPSNKVSVAEIEVLNKIDTNTYDAINLDPIFSKNTTSKTNIATESHPAGKIKTSIKPISLIKEQVFGKKPYIWPVSGKVVTKFGTASDGTRHDGINIECPENTPIQAIDNGVVVYAGNELRGYGNLVILKHNDGTLSAYAHQKDIIVVKHQTVAQFEVIGLVGATGHVKHPQLHLAIRKGSKAVNPEKYLPKILKKS